MALFVLMWMPPPYSPLHYALISVLEPPFAPLLAAAAGLLVSRFVPRATQPAWVGLIGSILCWTVFSGSVLTLGYLELVKLAILL